MLAFIAGVLTGIAIAIIAALGLAVWLAREALTWMDEFDW